MGGGLFDRTYCLEEFCVPNLDPFAGVHLIDLKGRLVSSGHGDTSREVG